MDAVDLIVKKRDGKTLSRADIDFFIRGVSDDSWADYQVSAMLMAMFIRGLGREETSWLTLAMASSGVQLDLSSIPGLKVDKHSTGGVADTTTLILAPLVAACGIPVIKMSGRGLGFTGGTIDKLESIPGMRTNLTKEEALEQVKNIGLAVFAQTENLTPADRRLYSLRDVTGTVDSIPLIAASIMSKKIAAGAGAIVLDVKCGSGAFMTDPGRARELARTMVDIGRQVGRRVTAVISSMDQPLGSHIGNALEVIEAIEILKGNAGGDLLEVSLFLGSQMLLLSGCDNEPSAREKLQRNLKNGKALHVLRTMIEKQGGNPGIIDDYSLFPAAAHSRDVRASDRGYITDMNTAELGRAFVITGGGRQKKTDPVDPAAGLIMHCRLGDKIEPGSLLCEVRANTEEKADAAARIALAAIHIGRKIPAQGPVIIDVIHDDLEV